MDTKNVESLISYLGMSNKQKVKYKTKEENKYLTNLKTYTINVFNKDYIFEAEIYKNVKNLMVSGLIPLKYQDGKLVSGFTIIDNDLKQLFEIQTLYYRLLREMYPDSKISHEKIDFSVKYELIDGKYTYSDREFDVTARINHSDFSLKGIGVIIERVVHNNLKKMGLEITDLKIKDDFDSIFEIIKMVKI